MGALIGPPNLLWLIEPQMWSTHDQSRASREGWLIDTHKARIRRWTLSMDTTGGIARPFQSDLQASEFVVERMHQGSPFHERAWVALIKLQMHGAET